MSTADQELRAQLADAYRLSDLMGWTEVIYNHISVRVPGTDNEFYINPFGLLHSEITPESLVRVDLDGNIRDPGSTSYGINKPGFVLHSAVHAARPDVQCVMHIHTAEGIAVSAMRCGLLPISQQALQLGEIRYHDYEGITIDEDERQRIVRDLGPTAKVLILRNHGLVTCGATVGEAFFRMYLLHLACRAQVMALTAGGPEALIAVSPAAAARTELVQRTILPEGYGVREFAALRRRLHSRS